MNVAVVGTGYVGLVAGACLAEAGNFVTCVDILEDRVNRLKDGATPIYEPGLSRLLGNNRKAGRLRFTTDYGEAVPGARAVFLAVGTPPGADGQASVGHVIRAARSVGEHLSENATVVMKSTVPVGTSELVRKELSEAGARGFQMCANPEFLKQGDAVNDFMYPDRVVCGVDSDVARDTMARLYAPFVRSGRPVLFMDIPSAELAKYAANTMLAARISFMNELSRLCEVTGADIEDVRRAIGTDPRIGPYFLYAGTGFGGSCFPKDVAALVSAGKARGVDLQVADAVLRANTIQCTVLVRKIVRRFATDLTGRRFAVWGLAFKPETDDTRQAPSLKIIRELLDAGATVAVHDPAAMEKAKAELPLRGVDYCDNEYDALDGADGLVMVTEWMQYRQPDWQQVAARMKHGIVFDGRNVFDPRLMRERGFEHYPIGRIQTGPDLIDA